MILQKMMPKTDVFYHKLIDSFDDGTATLLEIQLHMSNCTSVQSQVVEFTCVLKLFSVTMQSIQVICCLSPCKVSSLSVLIGRILISSRILHSNRWCQQFHKSVNIAHPTCAVSRFC